jgi:hypothetical protein
MRLLRCSRNELVASLGRKSARSDDDGDGAEKRNAPADGAKDKRLVEFPECDCVTKFKTNGEAVVVFEEVGLCVFVNMYIHH